MLSYLSAGSSKTKHSFLSRPTIVIGVPSGITNVEVRAVRDAAKNSGAGEVYIVEEPMAAAIGVRLPVHEPVGNMIVDIGEGTDRYRRYFFKRDSFGQKHENSRDKLNQDIIQYAKDEFQLLLGEKTAEDVKISIGSVIKNGEGLEALIRGRDMITGLPREVIVTDSDIREALIKSVKALIPPPKRS